MSFGIPFCVEAPGVLVAMSNKRDLPDAVRATCEARGRWWCFDPMRICNYDPAPPWWWNPLADIEGPTEAEILADLWANANADPNATKSAFFDSRGPALLAGLLLAAAKEGLQMPVVFRWIANPNNHEPVELLTKYGFTEMATFLRGIYNSSGTERTGLFSTASNAVKFMVDPRVLAWITDDGSRPRFDPKAFVRSGRDTLMLLSKEGKGTAAPLTAALTIMVTKAAEEHATEHAHGRLPCPLTIVGDEIANVWRWQEVPAKVTYYGSTGICLVAIFQNWSQAVQAYGADGAMKLFEACTTRIIGGGLADKKFLSDVSELVGRYHLTKRSAQYGRGGSMTATPDKELILDVDELYALRDHLVVLPAVGYAVLGRPVRWRERPYAARVQASIDRYEPAGVTS
jgi:type IV secretory pathway TraG/TraD family ATPase VirD4